MAMSAPQQDRNHTTVRFHPWVFKAVAGLVLLMIIAAWGFTATWSDDSSESYTGLVLAMVSYFCVVALGLGWMMVRLARRNPDPARREGEEPSRQSFYEWKSHEIEVGSGHQRGSHAAIDVILVPAAVAFGMLALVIVWHLAPGG